MRQLTLFFFIVSAFTIGCKSVDNNTTLQQQAWDEMMVIHDEVMPKMGDITRLSKNIKTALSKEGVSEQQKQTLQAAAEKLTAADEGMWAWMNNLKQLHTLKKDQSHEAIMDYLKTETATISDVKEQMLEAINAAETALK